MALWAAMGMYRSEILRVVSLEYMVTLLYGMVAGVGLGLLGAHLYVPFFPVSARTDIPVPPFLPLIAWNQAAWIAVGMSVTLMVVEASLLIRIARVKAAECLRLGTLH